MLNPKLRRIKGVSDLPTGKLAEKIGQALGESTRYLSARQIVELTIMILEFNDRLNEEDQVQEEQKIEEIFNETMADEYKYGVG